MLSLFLALHCLFTPPDGWEIADPKTPAQRPIIGFVDKTRSGFRPSLHLTHEKTSLPMKEYLEVVKKNSLQKKRSWKELGTIETKSGKATMIEVEISTQFGKTRLLQALLRREEDLFILTAGATKKEFGKYATKIERAFSSMELCDDLFTRAGKDEPALREAWQKKKSGVESEFFYKKVAEHSELGTVWQLCMGTL